LFLWLTLSTYGICDLSTPTFLTATQTLTDSCATFQKVDWLENWVFEIFLSRNRSCDSKRILLLLLIDGRVKCLFIGVSIPTALIKGDVSAHFDLHIDIGYLMGWAIRSSN
jgi:hypothetical protein